MNIVILGAGNVGVGIANHLASSENDITIVDSDRRRLNMIGNILDVRPVIGFASHPSTLEKAGAADADVLIAVTNIDEINLVACEVAHSLFGIETKIARVRQQDYVAEKYRLALFQPQNLSVDYIISPEIEIAQSISKSTQVYGTSDVVDLDERVRLVKVRCPDASPIVNVPLRIFTNLYPHLPISIAAIQRAEQTIIPSMDDVILANDQLSILLNASQVRDVMTALGYTEQFRRRVAIAGGGGIGLALAKEIEQLSADIQLKIIDNNLSESELDPRVFAHAELIKGNPLNEDILFEAGIHDCDTFISVTPDDNINVVATLLAKYHGVKRGISLLNNARNSQFVLSLGIDSIVNQNAITVSSVLRSIRQHKIRSLYAIDGEVEILGIHVNASSNIIGLSIDDISISHRVLVAVLKRGDEVYLSPRNFTISVDDYVILAVNKAVIHKIEKLVTVKFA
ncbi:MAG: Trk system potassium transporter TrkA [Holosporales bacterium]|jgi:trk system potassium uptake protein TrkA|nr:Trk system potassium transporter TrkA [Holosporales bacterium]